MWFSLGRSEGFPTQYPANASAVHFDTLEVGIIVAFVILMICFAISIPSTNRKTNIHAYARIFLQLLIGLLVLLGNFGQDWETAVVQVKTPYKAGIAAEIEASIGIHIGLRSVNVTLKSNSSNPELKNEIIDYNERFTWTWDQGNFGFGPFAGRLQQEFRAAQLRGVPTPILWVVDYFVIDGEGFRYGRFYRTSGWYCHILMWTAFATWLLALILFRSVIVYGGYCLGMTGLLQLAANLLWVVVKNPSPLVIPFDGVILTTAYGVSFWITFVNGLLSVISAISIIIMDQKYDDLLYTFFDVDPLTSFDEISYLTPEEESVLRHKEVRQDIPLIPMRQSVEEEEEDQNVEYIPVYKKRGTVRYRHHVALPPPVPREKKPRHLMNQVV
ncbi:dual oxidase maturation factor 1-like [Harmonia axyridis]|uniref:dual oxidase maturation factor 1-like n=1 Tax=Harmonia axyridis TaxID=115357 RepID=UPI001E27705D|nr:dual oxidase maturation factor 1-like [Harmonia axyridis]